MYGNKTKWGTVAGFWLAATLVSAAPPGSAPKRGEGNHGHPVPTDVDPTMHGYLPRHWELWANYCAEKRREHDPVRHYYPLVRLKHAILPHHDSWCGHCGHDACGQCRQSCHQRGGHDCCHDGAAVSPAASAGTQNADQPDAARRLAQPPAPLIDESPRPAQPSSPVPTDRPDQPSPAIRRLPPEEPIVIPPTTEDPVPPKNPLPKKRVGGTPRPGSPRPEQPREVGDYFDTQ